MPTPEQYTAFMRWAPPPPDRCFACGGPAHPATGHAFAADILYCGTCAGRFWGWAVRHTKRRWSGGDFYAEAATSIRACATVPV